MDSKNNLMDFYVGRVLKKHDVSPEKVDLSEEEKEKLRGIIENIQTDVEKFLDQSGNQITEKDFPNENEGTLEETNEKPTANDTEPVQQPKTKPKMFVNNKKKK